MIVIVTRYAEMSLSICCEISTTWALAAEARHYLDEAMQEGIARQEKEKKKQHRREEAAGKVPRTRE